jgi:hypothetical protein
MSRNQLRSTPAPSSLLRSHGPHASPPAPPASAALPRTFLRRGQGHVRRRAPEMGDEAVRFRQAVDVALADHVDEGLSQAERAHAGSLTARAA